jgi:hypothetical protein
MINQISRGRRRRNGTILFEWEYTPAASTPSLSSLSFQLPTDNCQ